MLWTRFNPLALTATLTLLATVGGCSSAPSEPMEMRAATVATAVGQPAMIAAEVSAALQPSVSRAGSDDAGGQTAVGALADEEGCVALSWEGLSLHATFDGCHSAATGAELDGSLTVWASVSPLGLGVTVHELAVDGEVLQGDMLLTLDGQSVVLDAEVAYSGTEGTLAIDELRVHAESEGLAVDLAGELDIDGELTSIDAVDVVLPRGICLPISGFVDFQTGELAGTIEFLAATPVTGVVEVTFPGMDPVELEVFAPCA